MDQRLEVIYRMIPPGRGVIDVGTDHGYLPERLALNGYPGAIYASDLRAAPLDTARRNAMQSGVSDRIHFLLSDGLSACPPEAVDTIVIAGMGGDTICGILDRSEWCMSPDYRLILQPMTRAEVLRFWLCNNGFQIVEEQLVDESETTYQIIRAAFRNKNERFLDAELFLGKPGLADNALYQRLLRQQIRRLEQQIDGLRSAQDTERHRAIPFLESILAEMNEFKDDVT